MLFVTFTHNLHADVDEEVRKLAVFCGKMFFEAGSDGVVGRGGRNELYKNLKKKYKMELEYPTVEVFWFIGLENLKPSKEELRELLIKESQLINRNDWVSRIKAYE